MGTSKGNPLKEIPDDIKEPLFKVRIKLFNGKIVERDCMADVTLNYDMLEEQLMENPSIFAYFSMLLAEQRGTVAAVERKIASRRAKVRGNILEESRKNEYGLKLGDIKELIDADDTIIKYEAELIMANKTLSKLYGLVDALKMKNDNLRSLGKFKKDERDV